MQPTAAPSFETKIVGAAPDATAPDGTAVRLLLSLPGGSMAHFELPSGAVSHAVTHRTVEEIWFIVSGRGSIWRRRDGLERIEALSPGASLTIPLGTAFQFRAEAGAPLSFVAITMPPWPGKDEALTIDGPWAPTVAAGPV
jgi:mannose-6-phosphate isomerase-like protein (cupin superfamily)